MYPSGAVCSILVCIYPTDPDVILYIIVLMFIKNKNNLFKIVCPVS